MLVILLKLGEGFLLRQIQLSSLPVNEAPLSAKTLRLPTTIRSFKVGDYDSPSLFSFVSARAQPTRKHSQTGPLIYLLNPCFKLVQD